MCCLCGLTMNDPAIGLDARPMCWLWRSQSEEITKRSMLSRFTVLPYQACSFGFRIMYLLLFFLHIFLVGLCTSIIGIGIPGFGFAFHWDWKLRLPVHDVAAAPFHHDASSLRGMALARALTKFSLTGHWLGNKRQRRPCLFHLRIMYLLLFSLYFSSRPCTWEIAFASCTLVALPSWWTEQLLEKR